MISDAVDFFAVPRGRWPAVGHASGVGVLKNGDDVPVGAKVEVVAVGPNTTGSLVGTWSTALPETNRVALSRKPGPRSIGAGRRIYRPKTVPSKVRAGVVCVLSKRASAWEAPGRMVRLAVFPAFANASVSS